MTILRAVTGGTESADGAVAQAAVPSILLTIPCPPSVNEMFRNVPGKGRVKTAAYVDWRGHAGWVLRSQKPGRIEGQVLAVVSVERGSASADIDNRIKAIFDLLVKHRVILDDSHIVGFCAAWAPAGSKLARVMLIPAGSYAFRFHLAADGAHGGWFLDAPPPLETI